MLSKDDWSVLTRDLIVDKDEEGQRCEVGS